MARLTNLMPAKRSALPLALKYAKGATTNVSSIARPIKYPKYSLRSSNAFVMGVLNAKRRPSAIMAVVVNAINTVL